jgi:hypothetical protein
LIRRQYAARGENRKGDKTLYFADLYQNQRHFGTGSQSFG